MTTAAKASVIVVLSLIASCDSSLENSRLGVTLDAEERMRILYQACQDERISTVELVDVQGAVGGADDTVVWGAQATDPISLVDVVVGEGGDGFQETTPLSTELAGDYTVILNAGAEGEVLQVIEVDALRTGLIDTGAGGSMPQERFEREAIESCA